MDINWEQQNSDYHDICLSYLYAQGILDPLRQCVTTHRRVWRRNCWRTPGCPHCNWGGRVSPSRSGWCYTAGQQTWRRCAPALWSAWTVRLQEKTCHTDWHFDQFIPRTHEYVSPDHGAIYMQTGGSAQHFLVQIVQMPEVPFKRGRNYKKYVTVTNLSTADTETRVWVIWFNSPTWPRTHRIPSVLSLREVNLIMNYANRPQQITATCGYVSYLARVAT